MKTPFVAVSTVEIPVARLHRALAWYADVLGLERVWSDEHHALMQSGEDSPRILLVATADEMRLTFKSSHNGLQHSVIDLRTADLEAFHAHLLELGTEVDDLGPATNDWSPRGFGFFDSEGNRLGAFAD